MTINLGSLDYEIAADKSGSMHNSDCPGGKSRWQYMQEQVLSIAQQVEKHDSDGITVVPFATTHRVHEGVTSQKLADVFKEHNPAGSTNTASMIEDRLNAYFDRKAKGGTKPLLLIVATDGAPDDEKAVANVIIAATKRMERDDEIAISIVQVGNDQSAAKFCQFLDDSLMSLGAKFDIVDTLRLEEFEKLSLEDYVNKSFAD